MYHGSNESFGTKTRANMDIQGSFFSPWKLDASGYGANVRLFFFNLRNPANAKQPYAALTRFIGQNGAGVQARKY